MVFLRCIRIVVLTLAAGGVLGAISLHPSKTESQIQSNDLRRITRTSEAAINLNPTISGDGHVIAFETTEDLAAAGGPNHFRAISANVSTEPPDLIQMGVSRAVAPAISQNGSRIAFASNDDPLATNPDGNSEIFLFDGARLTQVTNTSPGSLADRITNGNFQPSISDDGRFVAFASNRDLSGRNSDGNLEIFVYDSDSRTFNQMTDASGIVGFTEAKISGNGNFVAYLRDNGIIPGTTRDLLEQPRSGGTATVLVSAIPSLALTYGRAISDDGSRVVYSAQTGTNATQVFLYDGRAGAGVRQITSLGARVTEVPLHASISGDGTRISFATRRSVSGAASNTDGSVELYVYDLPTASFSKITSAPSSATADVISSLSDDGSLVAFNFPRVLSDAVVNDGAENNSEIYVANAPLRPLFGALKVLNGASLDNDPATSKAVAPDSIAVARGTLLASSTQQSNRLPNGAFPTNVAGTTVTVNGRPAEIFFVSPAQVNFLVPAQTEIGPAEVIVTNAEGFSSRGSTAVLRSSPGIFTKTGDGAGEAIAINSDTLQQAPFDPGDGQLRLTLFATGVRQAAQVSVTVGGQIIEPELLLPSAEMPGLDEIHLQVPATLKGAGVVTLSVQSDSRQSNASNTRFAGGDILINEVLADPPGAAPLDLAGDANHDGTRSASDDEFVELVNSTSRDLDLSGFQLFTRASNASETLRHTFAPGTIVAAQTAVVVFGGGSPDLADKVFGGAQVFKASTGGLSLSNTGGFITLRDNSAAIANIFEYGGATGLSGGANQSLTRAPDITGPFTLHTSAGGAGGRLFSPGTRLDGTPFLTISIAHIAITPASTSIDAGSKQQFTATAVDAANHELPGVIFTWQSSNSSVATIDQNGSASSLDPGVTEITASGRGIRSALATLTVRALPRVLTKIEVTPAAATIPVSGARQFSARGLDQFGNELAGLTFAWESTAAAIATVDQNGLAAGIAPGEAVIKAATQGLSGSATITVTPPTLVINELLADPPAGAQGDANHDGTRDGAQDEFIELVNSTGSATDLSGWTLRTHSTSSTTESVRHTFGSGSNLPPGEALVVFGGGTFDPANAVFGCARVLKASSGGLSLTNSGLTVLLRDATGALITQLSYGGSTNLNGGNAQSMTRSPDISGSFVLHGAVAGANGQRYSPGLKLDGTPFDNCPGHPSSITLTPTATSVVTGEPAEFKAQAFDQFGRAMLGVPITFVSDNPQVATIDAATPNPLTGVFTAILATHNPGIAHINASADDGTSVGQSKASTLTVTGPALSINDVVAKEGDNGPTTVTFTVSLTQPAPANGVKFDLATRDGTATVADNDYLPRSLTNQVIAAGAVSYTFDVLINGDTAIEPDEAFLVNVSNVAGATVARNNGTATIVNDDSPVLNISDVSASESDTGTTIFSFTVRSTLPAPANGITFDIATADGTALAGSDYVARALTNQTILAGQSSYSFDVTVNGDTLVESNETFLVNLSNVSSNASIGIGRASGIIQNDDAPLLVISQLYGGGGNSGAVLKNDFIEIYNRGLTTVDLAGWSVQYLSPTGTSVWSVTPLCSIGSCLIQPGRYFLVQEGQGGAGTESLSTPDAIGTIAMTTSAGKIALTSGVTALNGACPTSTTIFDLVGYGSSASCFEGAAPASAPGNVTALFRKAGGCVDTNDNQTDFFVAAPNPRNRVAPPGDCRPEVTINDVTVTEANNGPVNATFTVSITAASAQIVTVDFATADGTANAPADYQATTGTLTFNPGEISKPITVPVNGDTLDEPAETFFVNLSNAINAVILDPQGQATINDNDPAPSLAINDVQIAEGDTGTNTAAFTVSLSTPSGRTVTVNYATADNTATAGSDYQTASGTLIFLPGEKSKLVPITINGDLIFEPNETFFVNLSGAINASVADNQGVGTITNDDPVPPKPTLSISDSRIVEGDTGDSVMTFDVQLSPASSGVVTVDYGTRDDTASADRDYQATSDRLTFAAGETAKTISIKIHGDTLVEPDETFSVTLANATGDALIRPSPGTGTIQNDDIAQLVISQLSGGGNNAGALYQNDFVEIFNRGTTTVDFALTPYSIQYAGVGSNFGTNKTNLTTGMIAPGRYFLVRESGGAINGGPLPTADATGSINLGSTAGKVALVLGTNALPALTCPGDDNVSPFNPNEPNIADLVGYGNNASTSGHCYEGAGPATATSNTTAFIRRAGGCTETNNNSADSFTAVPLPRNSSSPSNDCAGSRPSLFIDDVTTMEADSGTTTVTFNVSLSAPAQGADVTFDIATQDGSARTADHDYVAKELTNQIIPAGRTNYSFSVTINGDTLIEPDETFFVNVTNVSGAIVSDGQGTATIQNDDLPALSINDVAAAEGDSGTKLFSFQVTLSAPAPRDVSFDIATADATATTADNDYVPLVLQHQTIVQGQTSYTFDVIVNGDQKIEPDETFVVNVSNVAGATVVQGHASGTIQNDDTPVLSVNDVSQVEGDSGSTTFIFTVTSSLPAPPGGISFDIATSDGTAQDHDPTTEDNDYVAAGVTGQTITEGMTSTSFAVTVNGDTLVEPAETFFVNITNVSNAGIGDAQGQGTIQNDDTPSLVISQLYGGGNNSGAIFQNDFVEIFNRGTTSVNFAVTPYSIQYASASGTFSTSNTFGLTAGKLIPGQYFLVQLGGGTANGVALPTADAIGSINMSAVDGKAALVAGTTTAGTVGGCPSGVSIADLVGYGAANCAETTGVAALSATKSALRKSNGCTDTDNNSADFTTPIITAGNPPHNSASPINDCHAPPSLTIDNVSSTEGNNGTKTFSFTVSLSKPALTGGINFDIATQDGSASAGSDYVAVTLNNQTIAPGQQTYNFNVTVNGDTEVESDETFFVDLTNVTGATVLNGHGVGTIQNDDTPALAIDDVIRNEGNSGTTTYIFTVTLNPASNQTVTVNYATEDGSALAASDYTAIPPTQLTFSAGETTRTIAVTVNGDTSVETDETFLVNLTGATNAIIADSQGMGTIANDDGANVLISQIYGGGGNTSATYNADFVELFNRTSTPINVSTWSIQSQSATILSGNWSVAALCPTGICIIPANSYYLVRLTNPGINGAALPAPDAVPATTINLSATAAKVALVNSTTPLTSGGAGCPTSFATVIDFVGYGSAANCFEGAGPAPGPPASPTSVTNTTSVLRKANGCQDSNANSADFVTSSPATPRNHNSTGACP